MNLDLSLMWRSVGSRRRRSDRGNDVGADEKDDKMRKKNMMRNKNSGILCGECW